MVGKDTPNPELCAFLLYELTCDPDVGVDITNKTGDCVNNKAANERLINGELSSDNAAQKFLGGQNPFAYFEPVAENIKIAPLSAYDQGCVELIQNSFSDYLQGKVDYDKAKKNFETAIKERYPDIEKVTWPK